MANYIYDNIDGSNSFDPGKFHLAKYPEKFINVGLTCDSRPTTSGQDTVILQLSFDGDSWFSTVEEFINMAENSRSLMAHSLLGYKGIRLKITNESDVTGTYSLTITDYFFPYTIKSLG